ncbi:HTH domain-containing protein [Corynebacterium diphtheriae]
MKRTERLHAISESLRRSGARGQTAEKLADEFGVTVRTIKRDLEALKTAGTPHLVTARSWRRIRNSPRNDASSH